ncbi:hypothetical protein [Bacillus cereus]|uniref:hypothetical protein n=1 Tax=Bacillus cereus TaxID=1396 RepID=UPI002D7703C0|nr:hypothetical protein [Bacillus cereus]
MTNNKEEKIHTSDSCFKGIGIALKHERVIKAINHKINQQYVFRGYKCEGITIPEVVKIHLDFDCQPKEPCNIEPSLYVTVNIIKGYVEHIEGENT